MEMVREEPMSDRFSSLAPYALSLAPEVLSTFFTPLQLDPVAL